MYKLLILLLLVGCEAPTPISDEAIQEVTKACIKQNKTVVVVINHSGSYARCKDQ